MTKINKRRKEYRFFSESALRRRRKLESHRKVKELLGLPDAEKRHGTESLEKKPKRLLVDLKSFSQRKKQLESYQSETEELLRRFDTEERCREHLFKQKWPEGYRCPKDKPGSDRPHTKHGFYYNKINHTYVCRDQECRCEVSLKKGTVLKDTNTNLTEWFRVIIYLVRTVEFLLPSARQLYAKLGIQSYDRALRMKKKIEEALFEKDACTKLCGLFDQPSIRATAIVRSIALCIQRLRRCKKGDRREAMEGLFHDLERLGIRFS